MMLNLLRALAGAQAIACAVFLIRIGEPSSLWWWPWGSFLFLWNTAPPAVALAFATKFRRTPFTVLMIVYLLLTTATGIWLCHDALFVSNSPTAGIILLFLPIYGWGALIALTMIASSIGWCSEK